MVANVDHYLIGDWTGLALSDRRHVRALFTGHVRPPRQGEWYLSGAILEAYMARVDMTEARPIARLVLAFPQPPKYTILPLPEVEA